MNLTTFFLRPRILNRSLLAWIFLIIGLIGVWDINSTDNKGIMIIETLLAGFMIAFFYFDKFMQDSKKMAYYLLFKNILHEGKNKKMNKVEEMNFIQDTKALGQLIIYMGDKEVIKILRGIKMEINSALKNKVIKEKIEVPLGRKLMIVTFPFLFIIWAIVISMNIINLIASSIMVAGIWCNCMVVFFNGFKMPVKRRKQGEFLNTYKHFTITRKSKIKFYELGDIHFFGKNKWMAYSVGDVLIVFGFIFTIAGSLWKVVAL